MLKVQNIVVMVRNNCIVELQRDAYVKDLVVFDEKLNFSQHISERIDKALYSTLWMIRRNFRDIALRHTVLQHLF